MRVVVITIRWQREWWCSLLCVRVICGGEVEFAALVSVISQQQKQCACRHRRHQEAKGEGGGGTHRRA